MAPRDLLTSQIGNARESVSKLAKLSIERELDLVVLYAVGDADGPLAGEMHIGCKARKAYAEFCTEFGKYRSRDAIVHVELFISGRAAGLRLKSAIEHHPAMLRRDIREGWWRVESDQMREIVLACIASEYVSVMTEAEADELERRRLWAIMDKMG